MAFVWKVSFILLISVFVRGADPSAPITIKDGQWNKYLEKNLTALRKGGVNLSDQKALQGMVRDYAESFADDMNAKAVVQDGNWVFKCADGSDPTSLASASCPGGAEVKSKQPTAVKADNSRAKAPKSPPAGGRKYKPSDPLKDTRSGPMDYKGAAQKTPAGRCDFGPETSVYKTFEASRKKCFKASQNAKKTCKGQNNTALNSALKAAKASMKIFGNVRGNSALAACNTMSDNSDNLSKALDNYMGKCVPQKKSCENSCLSASRSAKLIHQNLSRNPYCYKQLKQLSMKLKQMSDETTNRLVGCNKFEKQMMRSDQSAAGLLTSLAKFKNCEKTLSEENCKIDANSGKCSLLSGLDRPFLTPTSSPDANQNSMATRQVSDEHGDQLNRSNSISNQAQLSIDGQIAEKVNGATGSAGENRLLSRSAASRNRKNSGWRGAKGRGKRSKKYNFNFSDGSEAKSSSGADNSKSKLDAEGALAAYLPGGSNDPSHRIGTDGITSALGPGIFEKISRRYHLYKGRLLFD